MSFPVISRRDFTRRTASSRWKLQEIQASCFLHLLDQFHSEDAQFSFLVEQTAPTFSSPNFSWKCLQGAPLSCSPAKPICFSSCPEKYVQCVQIFCRPLPHSTTGRKMTSHLSPKNFRWGGGRSRLCHCCWVRHPDTQTYQGTWLSHRTARCWRTGPSWCQHRTSWSSCRPSRGYQQIPYLRDSSHVFLFAGKNSFSTTDIKVQSTTELHLIWLHWKMSKRV